jgi:type I restriction enzyme, S subunit
MELAVTGNKEQTSIGQIPLDWIYKPIDDEIDLLTGFPFPSTKYSKSGIRLLRGSNVKRGQTDWSEDIVQYWERITPEIQQYVLKEGDIVIAMDGSLVGRSFSQLKKRDLPALLLQRVARIRSSSIEINYLKEFLCSDYFTKHCDSVKTVSAIPHISPGDIKAFRIPIPPTRAEQTAIAAALSDAEALINSLEKLIEKKTRIRRGVMHELLRPKEGWEERRLGDLVKFEKGQLITQSSRVTGNIPVIAGGKSPAYYHNVANRFGKTITISASGASAGYVAFHNYPIYASDCSTIGESDSYSIEFVYYFLILHQNNIYNKQTGGAQPHIHAADLTPILIAVPSLEEQTRIASILSDIQEEIILLEDKHEKALKIKQGMMQNLLTGRVRLV